VGAGGGSIAQVDGGGALEVGPRSAGADPGPATYGKGIEPTVTDANVVLGRLPASTELGGTLRLDAKASERSLETLADSMGTDAIGAALGVIRVANSNMERALRRVSVERGHDPREFVLVAFGGAGPLHACELAEAIDVRKVLVPRYPGVTSAAGILAADAIRERSRTVMVPGAEWTIDELKATFGRLADEVEDDDAAEAVLLRSADVRYLGQGYELNVPLNSDDPGELIQRFHEAHELRFGYSHPKRDTEIVSIRVRRAEPSVHRGSLTRQLDRVEAQASGIPTLAVGANRDEVEATLFGREELGPGFHFVGPAIVTQPDATTYVPAEWGAVVDAIGNLILEPDSEPNA
jgi:N-methylhydantoinase A